MEEHKTKNKFAIFGTLLISNLNLFGAALSNNEQVAPSIGLDTHVIQEESKVCHEVLKVLEETKKIVQNKINKWPNSPQYLGRIVDEINHYKIKSAWDVLIKLDKQGSNRDKLKVLLKNKVIDINQESTIDKTWTPIRYSISKINYKLFKFLLDNGAILTKDDVNYLQKLFEINLFRNNKKEAIKLRKMIVLYYLKLEIK